MYTRNMAHQHQDSMTERGRGYSAQHRLLLAIHACPVQAGPWTCSKAQATGAHHVTHSTLETSCSAWARQQRLGRPDAQPKAHFKGARGSRRKTCLVGCARQRRKAGARQAPMPQPHHTIHRIPKEAALQTQGAAHRQSSRRVLSSKGGQAGMASACNPSCAALQTCSLALHPTQRPGVCLYWAQLVGARYCRLKPKPASATSGVRAFSLP